MRQGRRAVRQRVHSQNKSRGDPARTYEEGGTDPTHGVKKFGHPETWLEIV